MRETGFGGQTSRGIVEEESRDKSVQGEGVIYHYYREIACVIIQAGVGVLIRHEFGHIIYWELNSGRVSHPTALDWVPRLIFLPSPSLA